MDTTPRNTILNKISFYALLITAGVLPVFFIPGIHLDVMTAKNYFLVVGIAVSLIFWILARLKDGSFEIPKSPLLYIGGGVVFAYILSGIFSPATAVSFSGSSFEVGTVYSSIALFTLFFLGMYHFRTTAKISLLYMLLFGGFVLAFVFQTAFLFLGPNHLALGTFTQTISSLIGSWNDMGIYFGLIAVLSLLTLELFKIKSLYRSILTGALVVSLAYLALVNFVPAWIVLGAVSLVIFVYLLTVKRA